MTLQEFIDILREDFLDDKVEPYYWSDDTLIRYACMAEEEACRRAYILKDADTDSLCTINVLADKADYPLHPKILTISSAKNIDMDYPIIQTTKATLDNTLISWENLKSDTPKWFYLEDNNTLKLVPIPNSDFTLKLVVYRLPLISHKTMSSVFEIPEKYQRGLLFWATYLALAKQNINTRKDDKTLEHYIAMFNSFFGTRKTAKEEESIRRSSRISTLKANARTFGFP